jgi:MFS family permease
MILSGSLAGVLASRNGRYRRYIIAGLIIASGSFAVAATFDSSTPLGVVAAGMLLLGIGLGPTNALFLVAAQAAAPKTLLGTVTSSNQFFRQVGGTLALALFGALMAQQAALTFESDIKPLLSDTPPEVVALMATPELLTDPRLAAQAASELASLAAPGTFTAVVTKWRQGVGEGISLIYALSGALAVLALLAALLLPAKQLSDEEPDSQSTS